METDEFEDMSEDSASIVTPNNMLWLYFVFLPHNSYHIHYFISYKICLDDK